MKPGCNLIKSPGPEFSKNFYIISAASEWKIEIADKASPLVQNQHEWVPAVDGNYVYVGVANPDRKEYPGVTWKETHGSKAWFPESVHNKVLTIGLMPFLIKST